MSSQSPWTTQGVQGQPGIHNETLSQDNNNKNFKNNKVKATATQRGRFIQGHKVPK
jgi:hypothetical protein